MRLPSYMRSVVDRNVVTQRMTVIVVFLKFIIFLVITRPKRKKELCASVLGRHIRRQEEISEHIRHKWNGFIWLGTGNQRRALVSTFSIRIRFLPVK